MLPADSRQPGWVIVPITGAGGEGGFWFITMSAECSDVQPDSLETAKLYAPGLRFETVVLIPVPFVRAPSGYLVNVHTPEAGNPVRKALPYSVLQSIFVTELMTGAEGMLFTVRVKVAVAAMHGPPSGLLVETVMLIILPASCWAGV